MPDTRPPRDSFVPQEADLAFTRKSPYGTTIEPSFAGALSFMRRRYSKDLAGADVAVVGVPYDLAATNRSGTRLGPRAIRAASSILSWSSAWGWDFDCFERLAVIDWGDCLFDPGRPEGVPDEIEAQFRTIVGAGARTLALGGDHFISYPILKAYAASFGPMALIHFDAHSDTWADEPERLDHGTMFYHAAREGIVDPARSVQVGIRTRNDRTHGFNILDADWVRHYGIAATVGAIRDTVGESRCYLTFDIDCLDPAFAPGTGTPVVGGMNSADARALLRGLAGLDIVGADVVEVSPAYDVSEITALAAATLALDILCLFAARKGEGGA